MGPCLRPSVRLLGQTKCIAADMMTRASSTKTDVDTVNPYKQWKYRGPVHFVEGHNYLKVKIVRETQDDSAVITKTSLNYTNTTRPGGLPAYHQWKYTKPVTIPPSNLETKKKQSLTKHKPELVPELSKPLVKADIITHVQGQGVKLKKQPQTLINFTSQDVLSLQSHSDILDAQQKHLSEAGLSQHMRAFLGSEDLHLKVEDQLARLHNKEFAYVQCGWHSHAFDVYLKLIGKNDTVFVQKNAIFTESKTDAQKIMFDCNKLSGLESQLSHCKSRGQKGILVESCPSKVDALSYIDQVCDLARKYGALVLYNDRHGINVLHHILGSSSEVLKTLRRPLIVNARLDMFAAGSQVCYTAGPRSFVTLVRQRFVPGRHEYAISPVTLASVAMSLKLLPSLAATTVRAISNTLLLRHALEVAGISVEMDTFSLQIPVPDKTTSMTVKTSVAEAGFHVGAVQHGEQSSLQVTCTSSHNSKQISKLANTLVHALQQCAEERAKTKDSKDVMETPVELGTPTFWDPSAGWTL